MVNPSEFLDVLTRAINRLNARAGKYITDAAEQRSLVSVVGAWLSEYRPAFVAMLGDNQLLVALDDSMHLVNRLASEQRARGSVLREVRTARRYFSEQLLQPLTRAYWSRAPQRTIPGRDEEVLLRLRQLDPDLANGYEQAILDLENDDRLTYRGPAAELRELLTRVLHLLAPNEQVQATEWYRESRRSGARKEPVPRRAERTRFILRSRGQGSAADEAADAYASLVEERLEKVVDATYRRGSAATHSAAEREQVRTSLLYLNALLRELLPPGPVDVSTAQLRTTP